MTNESMQHLTDEALNDLLIGMGSAESQSHLASCSLCRQKIEDFRAGIDILNETTLAWSENRSSRARKIVAVRPWLNRIPLPVLGLALAAAILLTIDTPVWRHNRVDPVHQPVPVAAETQDTDEQIAQDNELLQAVNEAINPQDASPVNEYKLLDRPHPRHKQRPQ